MIHGFDISHHNGVNAVKNCVNKMLELNKTPEFVIIKASEGRSFTDKRFKSNMTEADRYNLVRGCYHYARPEINSPDVEVDNFMSSFHDYIGEAIPALDWEGEAERYPESWALEWLEKVYEKSGVKPLVYCGFYIAETFKEIQKRDYGLWLARWRPISSGCGSIEPWKFYAMWQYTNTPFDLDVFNGTRQQLLEYCKSKLELKPEKFCDCYCGCSCCGIAREDEE